MTQQQKQTQIQALQSKWTLWISFSCEYQKDIDYGNNLLKILQFNTWPDLIYFWNNSKLKNTSNYFVQPSTGKYNKYQIGQQLRKIDSINFFRQQIQPKWQYGENSKGGYFNFSIAKVQSQQMVQKIYQATIFLAAGDIEQICQYLIGVRMVDTLIKQYKKNQSRVELWVNFRHNESQQSLKKLQKLKQGIIKYYLENINYKINQMRFFNISK